MHVFACKIPQKVSSNLHRRSANRDTKDLRSSQAAIASFHALQASNSSKSSKMKPTRETCLYHQSKPFASNKNYGCYCACAQRLCWWIVGNLGKIPAKKGPALQIIVNKKQMKMFQDFQQGLKRIWSTIAHWPQVFMNTGLTQDRFLTSIEWIGAFEDCFYQLFLWLRWIENIRISRQYILSRFWKAILTSIKYNQLRKKLQCLYENQMSNNFLKTDDLKKYMNCKLKLHSKR